MISELPKKKEEMILESLGSCSSSMADTSLTGSGALVLGQWIHWRNLIDIKIVLI